MKLPTLNYEKKKKWIKGGEDEFLFFKDRPSFFGIAKIQKNGEIASGVVSGFEFRVSGFEFRV